MKAIVLAFLLQLEAIGAADPAMFEMRVLSAVHQPIHAALVQGQADVEVPGRYGLSSADAERRLQAAVDTFIREARATPEYASARTLDARVELLFSEGVLTPRGHAYDDYFAFAGAP